MVDLDNLRQEGWPDAADEILRLRYALATVRDDLSSVTITGEELHNIIAGINDVLGGENSEASLMADQENG